MSDLSGKQNIGANDSCMKMYMYYVYLSTEFFFFNFTIDIDDIPINFVVDEAFSLANRTSIHLGIPKSSQRVNNVLPKFDGCRKRQMQCREIFEFNCQAGPCFPTQKFCS